MGLSGRAAIANVLWQARFNPKKYAYVIQAKN